MVSPSLEEPRISLARIMDESLEGANELLQILQDERQALENRDAEALGVAAEGKRKCVGRLEALETKRRTAAESLQPAAERWQCFLSVISRCNELNATNGAIIRLRRQQIAAAVKLIGGGAAETYGPTGTESPSRAGRALAAV
ncbi:MAG TPA: flagellar protein FlgN [Woeseiaceae bacterium]|nr:flagellar protein FlgN [Woeseiaceae bacterium]